MTANRTDISKGGRAFLALAVLLGVFAPAMPARADLYGSPNLQYLVQAASVKGQHKTLSKVKADEELTEASGGAPGISLGPVPIFMPQLSLGAIR
ncbi:MAG: hypothetical protein ACKVSF_10765 [Alphaproteobacteria bacterium]